jgi:hypothetical protein
MQRVDGVYTCPVLEKLGRLQGTSYSAVRNLQVTLQHSEHVEVCVVDTPLYAKLRLLDFASGGADISSAGCGYCELLEGFGGWEQPRSAGGVLAGACPFTAACDYIGSEIMQD